MLVLHLSETELSVYGWIANSQLQTPNRGTPTRASHFTASMMAIYNQYANSLLFISYNSHFLLPDNLLFKSNLFEYLFNGALMANFDDTIGF